MEANQQRGNAMATVYLIHFYEPLKHACHYLGFTTKRDAEERIQRHRQGRGSKLMRAVMDAGIPWDVVRVWKGKNVTRTFERKLKRLHNSKRLCPLCSGKAFK